MVVIISKEAAEFIPGTTDEKALTPQSTLYLHINKIVKEGILLKQREGKVVYYSFPSPKIDKLIPTVEISNDYDYDQP